MWIKLIVSLCAAVLVLVHAVRPDLKVDSITLGLVIVAVLPWLSTLIESAKFPGGWEVKFRDVQRAGEKVIAGEATTKPPSQQDPIPSFAQSVSSDPNLALVGLRIEIEKRIRALGEKAGLVQERSMMRTFARLSEMGVLNGPSLSGIRELVAAGNQAAHGARVDPQAAVWAFEFGPQVLAALDEKINKMAA